jgi:hypothetical protein
MIDSPTSVVLLGSNRNRVGSTGRGRCSYSRLIDMSERIGASIGVMSLFTTVIAPTISLLWVLGSLGSLNTLILSYRGVRIRVRRVLPSSFSAPPTTKRKQQSNPPKLITHPTQNHPSTQREKQGKKPPGRERKLLFACFMVVLVT